MRPASARIPLVTRRDELRPISAGEARERPPSNPVLEPPKATATVKIKSDSTTSSFNSITTTATTTNINTTNPVLHFSPLRLRPATATGSRHLRSSPSTKSLSPALRPASAGPTSSSSLSSPLSHRARSGSPHTHFSPLPRSGSPFSTPPRGTLVKPPRASPQRRPWSSSHASQFSRSSSLRSLVIDGDATEGEEVRPGPEDVGSSLNKPASKFHMPAAVVAPVSNPPSPKELKRYAMHVYIRTAEERREEKREKFRMPRKDDVEVFAPPPLSFVPPRVPPGKNSGRASPASRGSEAQTPPRRKPVGILSKPPKVPRVAFSAPTSPFLAPQTGTSTNFPMHSLHPLDDALHLQIEQETPLQTDDELLVITVDSPRRASSASPHSPRSPQGSPLARPSPRRPQSSSKRTPSPSSKLGIFGPSHRRVSPSPQRKSMPRRIAFAELNLGPSLEHGASATRSEDGRGTTLEHGSYAMKADACSAPVTLEPTGELILGPKVQRLNMTVGASEKSRNVWTATDTVLTTPEQTVLLPQTMSFTLYSELNREHLATARSITPREVGEPQSLTPIAVAVAVAVPKEMACALPLSPVSPPRMAVSVWGSIAKLTDRVKGSPQNSDDFHSLNDLDGDPGDGDEGRVWVSRKGYSTRRRVLLLLLLLLTFVVAGVTAHFVTKSAGKKPRGTVIAISVDARDGFLNASECIQLCLDNPPLTPAPACRTADRQMCESGDGNGAGVDDHTTIRCAWGHAEEGAVCTDGACVAGVCLVASLSDICPTLICGTETTTPATGVGAGLCWTPSECELNTQGVVACVRRVTTCVSGDDDTLLTRAPTTAPSRAQSQQNNSVFFQPPSPLSVFTAPSSLAPSTLAPSLAPSTSNPTYAPTASPTVDLCAPVVCPPPPSPCHAEGICSFVTTGTPECSHALNAELSECDDGDAVTVRDTCRLGQCQGEIIVPTPGPEVCRGNPPVLAGYDVVAYFFLDPTESGVIGSAATCYRHATYDFWFSSKANLELFVNNADRWLPQFGGFCAWGLANQWGDEAPDLAPTGCTVCLAGYPWSASHLNTTGGPPASPADSWHIRESFYNGTMTPKLYFNIYPSYEMLWTLDINQYISRAETRWIDWYGSLEAGPMNNKCYSWDYQEKCF